MSISGNVVEGFLFRGTVKRDNDGRFTAVRGLGFTPEDSIRDALVGLITDEQLAEFIVQFMATWTTKGERLS